MKRQVSKLTRLFRGVGVSVVLFSLLTSICNEALARLEYRQDISPGSAGMLAPELLARLKDGDKVVLVVNGEGWRDFDRPKLLTVKEKENDLKIIAEYGTAIDKNSHFEVMRNGDWFGFVFNKGGKKMALMADGNLVDMTKAPVNVNNKTQLNGREELWWGLYAYMNYHGAEQVITKLVSKGTTGFLRLDDNNRKLTTAMFGSYPAAYFEGAMINVVEIEQGDRLSRVMPGGKNFTYNPRLSSYRYPYFTKDWRIGTKGNGWVKFRAKAQSDIRVYFSAIINNDPENSLYCCSIGEKENTFSAFREKANSVRKDDASLSDPASFEMDKGQDPKVVIRNPNKFEDYWVKVENGELSWGTGKTVGQEIRMAWKDPSPLNDVKYVALGGLGEMVYFEDIELSPAIAEKPKVNLPDGYAKYAQAGIVDSVTVGSSDGALSAWAVQRDKLVRWNDSNKRFENYIASGLPSGANVSDVSAGSDGTVYVVVDGALYQLVGDKWSLVSSAIWSIEEGAVVQNQQLEAKTVAVGNADNVWALQNDSTKLYQLMTVQQGDEAQVVWVERSEFAVKVAAGLDNSAAAIDNQGFAYLFISGQWVNISNEREFHKLAVVTKDHIIAIGRDMNLYEYRSETGEDGVYVPGDWTPILGADKKPAYGFHKISVNTAGTTFASDATGVLYSSGSAGVSQAIVDSLAKAVAPIIAPEAPAEVAPGETALHFLTQLEAAVVQLESVKSLLSEEDVARVKELGSLLSGFVFEEKDVTEQVAEEQAAQQDVDTPPSKEEQVQEQVVENVVEEKIEEVVETTDVVPVDTRGRPIRGVSRPTRGATRGGTTRGTTVRTSTSGRGMTRGSRTQSRTEARSVRGGRPPVAGAVEAAEEGVGVSRTGRATTRTTRGSTRGTSSRTTARTASGRAATASRTPVVGRGRGTTTERTSTAVRSRGTTATRTPTVGRGRSVASRTATGSTVVDGAPSTSRSRSTSSRRTPSVSRSQSTATSRTSSASRSRGTTASRAPLSSRARLETTERSASSASRDSRSTSRVRSSATANRGRR